MSFAAVVVLGLALLALGGFIVLSVGLFHQGRDLARSATAFRDDVAPMMAQLTRDGDIAQQKAAGLQNRLQALREAQGSLRRSWGRR